MGTTLDELRKLKVYELGTLCHRFHIVVPGGVTESNRPIIERKLIVAIMTARGKERARNMLRQRSITQDNTSYILPLAEQAEMRRTTLYRPFRPHFFRRSSGGCGGTTNERKHDNIPVYKSQSTSSVVLPTSKSISVTLNENIVPLNDSKVIQETATIENNKPNDNEIQADGQILECELRTINYLSKEEELILSAERNSQEYQKRREAILNAIRRVDFDDLDDEGRGINSFDKVFSIFSALNRIGPFRQFNCLILCCGVSLCAYFVYKKLK